MDLFPVLDVGRASCPVIGFPAFDHISLPGHRSGGTLSLLPKLWTAKNMNTLAVMPTPSTMAPGLLQLSDMRQSAAQAVSLLKTLANENRLLIMCMLAEGECSVGQLNEQIDLSQSALSQHLAVLREQGLVETRRESQTIYYSLADSEAIPLIQTLHDAFCVD
jgi:DNA-binding transcriptional ArsR family regulator